jgi:DNA repair ATPase RecN
MEEQVGLPDIYSDELDGQPALLNLSKADSWLTVRIPQIKKVLSILRGIPRDVVGDDMTNLNRLHTVMSNTRERQQYVQTYLLQVINLQREVKSYLSLAMANYKDAMGKAFTQHAEVISSARSYDEKELRLRQYVPEISEKEIWEGIADQVESLKEGIKLVYDDFSKDAMSISLQRDVVQSQIYTGELKIRVEDLTARNMIRDAQKKELPGPNAPNGEFSLDI